MMDSLYSTERQIVGRWNARPSTAVNLSIFRVTAVHAVLTTILAALIV